MTVTLGIAACLVVSYIVVYPDHILESSLEGLTIWWKIVFPAMLPFLIIIEIMSALGVMHFLGSWLDPIMRRLFGLPGIAGWCMTVGWLAGSPASARSISNLRRDGSLTRGQAERLMALSHAGSPVLLVIVIASGFLGHPELGLPILIIHWLSAIITAYASGGRSQDDQDRAVSRLEARDALNGSHSRRRDRFATSLHAMHEARTADGRPFGRLLGDSVFESTQKLLVIGGYMIFFSVILEIMLLSGIGHSFVHALDAILVSLGIPAGERSLAMFYGLFEQHLGAYVLHAAAPDVWTFAAISALLGWSGLCLHAQVKAATSGTDIRYYPFLLSRLLHAMIGAVLAWIAYPWLDIEMSDAHGFRSYGETVSVWSPWPAKAGVDMPAFMDIIRFDAWLIIVISGLLFMLFILTSTMSRIRRWRRRTR